MKKLIFIFLITLVWSSCSYNNVKKEKVEKIIYSVKCSEKIANSPLGEIFPDKMKLFFRNDTVRLVLSGLFNSFNIDFYSFNKKDSTIVTFKVLNKNLIGKDKPEKNYFIFDKNNIKEIIPLENQTKMIAGYECDKLLIYYNNKDYSVAYYCKDLNQAGNRNTPFKDIPGLMMQFNIYYNDILITFKAEEVDLENLSQDCFVIKQEHKKSSPEAIEEILTSLIDNFVTKNKTQ